MTRTYWSVAAAILVPLGVLASGMDAHAQTPAGRFVLTVEDVHSGQGKLVVALCDNPQTPFPGRCSGPSRTVQAVAGRTVVTFEGVNQGDYAVQVFHDEDGDNIPNVPPEGFAYGNNQSWPPDFRRSSVHVGADSASSVRMIYLDASFQPTAARSGSGEAWPRTFARLDAAMEGRG
jgi:uncharacterized protein (DUF2141 family)